MDANEISTVKKFDLTVEWSRLIAGLDSTQAAEVDNTSNWLSKKRSDNQFEELFPAFVRNDATIKKRVQMFLLPHNGTFVGMVTSMKLNGSESTIAQNRHRAMHAFKVEMKRLPETEELRTRGCLTYTILCTTAVTYRTHLEDQKKKFKVSLKHINGALDEFVQADYTVFIYKH